MKWYVGLWGVGKKLIGMMSRASRKGRIGGKRELGFEKRKGC